MKTGFLHDIAPRWFPPNALLQVTFRMNDGKVYLESYPKSMYFKPVNGTWSRISTDSFAFKPPFSISASQRGTYTVAFYLDKHERDVSQHTHLSVSGNNWQPSARFLQRTRILLASGTKSLLPYLPQSLASRTPIRQACVSPIYPRQSWSSPPLAKSWPLLGFGCTLASF